VTGRREPLLAFATGGIGAALLLLSSGRPWTQSGFAHLARTGHQLTAVPDGCGVVALAGLAVIAVTRGRSRIAVALVVTIAGAGAVAASAGQLSRPALTGWPWLALIAGLLVGAAGVLVTVRGGGWAGPTARFAAGGARPSAGPRTADPQVAAWDALDRGEDPTLG
jgi:hypothetical protein